MLEMQMPPPGYRPRGGGISVMNEAEWKSRGNYLEIVDCVISRMQMEHLIKKGAGNLSGNRGGNHFT